MRKKNDGFDFEIQVYNDICNSIKLGNFFIMSPNMKIFHRKGYYSRDRKKDIITDISIEIYVDNPAENNSIKPSVIIVLECKDYTHSLSVDDVEEFHAKLQQIGADNTKGIIITRCALYQESAINYAKAKGIMIKAWKKDREGIEDIYASYFKTIDYKLSNDIVIKKLELPPVPRRNN